VFRALVAESCIFIGDEILSLSGATLIGGSVYRLQVIRQRFGTRKAAHTTGAEVWLISRSDIQPVTHPAIKFGVAASFKVVPLGSRRQLGIDNVDEAAKYLTGSPFVSTPRNLRISGSGFGTVPTGSGVTVTFSLPEGFDYSGLGGFRYSARARVFANGNLRDERTVVTPFVTYAGDEFADILEAETTFRIEISMVASSEDLTVVSAGESIHGVII
jgi:hypothetical protein